MTKEFYEHRTKIKVDGWESGYFMQPERISSIDDMYHPCYILAVIYYIMQQL